MKNKLFRGILAFMLAVNLGALLTFPTAFAAIIPPDSESPSYVTGIKGTALNQAAKIEWDAAVDNVKVTGYQVWYGLTSIKAAGSEYEHTVDAGDVLSYTITDLENDKTYYFSVVAYDAAGNESTSWGLPEVSVKPTGSSGEVEDTTAPQVSSASALNKVEVKVTFSEAVVLPTVDAQNAFNIENNDTLETLDVTKAELDEEDNLDKTVILTTAEQTENVEYKLTAMIDIEDKSGNPIISGTSDTAIFAGSGAEKTAEDIAGPEVLTVSAVDNTHVTVTFNEPVVLTIEPNEDFSIIEEADGSKSLGIFGVELSENSAEVDDTVALLTTAPQEEKSYVLVASKLTDEADNEVNPAKGSAVFMGVKSSASGEDKTPPKDVAKFLAEVVLQADKYIVKLAWEIPAENKNDTAEQVIYKSTNGESYSKTTSVAPDVNKYEVKDLTAGDYWFKITQKDQAGNESQGVVKKITLSETGPEMLGLVFVSIALGRMFGKKRKK